MFWGENFSTGVDSKVVKIICKVFRVIYAPQGGGGSASCQRSVVSNSPELWFIVHALIMRRSGEIICKGLAPSTSLRAGCPGGRALRMRIVAFQAREAGLGAPAIWPQKPAHRDKTAMNGAQLLIV